METYAQNCEDLILQILLPAKSGFYVDVGANSPDTDSVTKLFYKKGWRGINIEPVSSLYKLISQNRPRDTNLNVGVAEKSGDFKIREYQNGYHGWSTFSNKIKNLNSRKAQSHKDYTVSVRTLRDIFADNRVKEIDFLKVDVEGFEYKVLISNDWQRWRPKVVVIENSPGRWLDLMVNEGYGEVFFDGLNHYFVADEIKAELMPGDNHLLIAGRLSQAVSKMNQKKSERELKSARLLTNNIINNPENYISCRRLSRSLLIQLRRRLQQ